MSTLASCANSAPVKVPAATASGSLPQFVLRDYFRREWRNELVTYPVDEKTASTKNLTLIAPDGTARPHQLLRSGQQTKIAFLADVPADGESTYRLGTGAPSMQTDIRIEETAGKIRLYNEHTGVDIRTALHEGEAPIAAIRLASGRWVGGSDRTTPQLEDYQARIVEGGPVLSEAKFAGGANWRMRFRLIANEPVVLVSESTYVGTGASWSLRLDPNFNPTHLFHKSPMVKKIVTSAIEGKPHQIFLLEPWVRWWELLNGNWVSFYNEGTDLLSLHALDPAVWVDPEKRRNKVAQSPPQIPVVTDGSKISAQFDLTGGVRRWMISALDKSQSIDLLQEKELKVSPPPQQYLIKHGDFPLDRVKDLVLTWPDTAERPRVMVTQNEVARYRKTNAVDAALLEKWQKTKLNRINIIDAVPIYLATGDEQMGRKIAEIVLELMQNHVGMIIGQETKGSLGAWPHNQSELHRLFNIADVVWASGFTLEEKTRVKAQAALLGYTVNSPHYWSPERGYKANPNMTTMVAGYQAGAGALLADHPMSKEWFERGLAEMKQQAENWTDANGGPLEAPHYALTSYELWLGQFVAARSFDNGKLLYQDKMRKATEYFAKISTPPDSRVSGIRHMPRVGDTWLNEPSGIFGLVAALWKERDPQFASEMQWMYKQHGSQPHSAIGGAMPAFEGFRELNLDLTIPEKKPEYKSTLFPQTGVSLRNGVDDRETQLYLIAGHHHEHYDHDSGSITLWGKGRAVADDFAYGQRDPKSMHSMVESGGQGHVMEVKTFAPSEHFDFVRGVSGVWHRQIAFVKDKDMLAPNYFVLRDSMQTPTTGTWRLWLDGKINVVDANASGQGVQVQAVQLAGEADVDTDIALITNGGVKVSTQAKTTHKFGMGPDLKKAQKLPVSLNAIIAPMAAGQDVLSLIYPRLKTQKPPKVTPLADGRALKVEHEAGTDYIFLNDEPFSFEGEGIQFEGTSGLVKIRGNKVWVELGAGDNLTFRGQSAAANASQP